MRVLTATLLLAGMVSTAASGPVDDYVKRQMTARKLPGVSLAVVQHGRIVKAEGYGVASLELRAAATAQTVYEIGSISKQFAADAILLLAEERKLQLDDPIAKYVDGTPPEWSAITIRRILTHTAGLADFDTGNIGFSYRREYTPAEFVALMAAQPLKFPPGGQWAYTNAFPLLGMVVERVAGVPYTTFVENRIFKPLGLTSARFKMAGDVVPNRADGYLLIDGAYRHGETLRPAVIAANGGIMINVVDFARWDIAMTSGRLLRPESIKAMTTPVRLNDGRTVSHGLGWFIDQFNGHAFGAHWGTTVAGHSAVIRRYVDDGVTVIVMSNLNDDGLAVDAISKWIADHYVPGVDIHTLRPIADQQKAEWARLRKTLEAVATGAESDQAPGLVARLPARVRERIADTLRTASSVDYLGEEQVGATHFSLDPLVVRFRRYRAATPSAMRYLTLRLAASGELLGVVIED
ncbi:MAG: serine hydrolase domain-containing protein [Vicinamibacterales bacterium]